MEILHFQCEQEELSSFYQMQAEATKKDNTPESDFPAINFFFKMSSHEY